MHKALRLIAAAFFGYVVLVAGCKKSRGYGSSSFGVTPDDIGDRYPHAHVHTFVVEKNIRELTARVEQLEQRCSADAGVR